VRVPIRLGSAIAVAAAGLATAVALPFATPALASTAAPAFSSGGASHAVFVQTDNTSGNQVVAYYRAPDGTLSPAGTYATGGLGGVLAGSVVDHLASQGSLSYDPGHGLLYAVNAGSDTVSVFAVNGDRLALRQVLSSGARSRSAWPCTVTWFTCSTRWPAAVWRATACWAAGWSRSPAPAARSA
jgi:hypothetical protein